MFSLLVRRPSTGWVMVAITVRVVSLPTLVVVSGPAGAGKTTLAHLLARAVGCPAICRDEIKESMAHSSPGFAPAPGDELTMRILPVFFGVVELLLRAGVTTIADAAFQDHVWRPRLEAFLEKRPGFRLAVPAGRHPPVAQRPAWRQCS
jgi:predicted kinase